MLGFHMESEMNSKHLNVELIALIPTDNPSRIRGKRCIKYNTYDNYPIPNWPMIVLADACVIIVGDFYSASITC